MAEKKTKNLMKGIVNSVFVLGILVFLLVGTVRTFTGTDEFLELENRNASVVMPFTFESFLSGEFQDSVENALSDHVEGSAASRKVYNSMKSAFVKNTLGFFMNFESAETVDESNHEMIIDDESEIGGIAAESEFVDEIIESYDEVAPEEVIESYDEIMPQDIEFEPQPEQMSDPEEQTPEPAEQQPVGPEEQQQTEPEQQQTESEQQQTEPEQQQIEPEQQQTEPEQQPTQTEPEVQPTEQPSAGNGGRYYSVGSGLYIYNDYVVQGVASLKLNKSRFDKFISAYNNRINDHPEISFYLYYIERDSDQNYATGYRAEIYDYIKSAVNLPEDNMSCQRILNFDEYTYYNYKSDHHWSYRGSYAGYCDIMSMLRPFEYPLQPIGEYKIGTTKGSFTKTQATAGFKDTFYAYEFAFPEMEFTINGKAANDYGSQPKYLNNAKAGNENQSLMYGGFYGGDSGEIVIHNPSGSGSIMLFGNSYDNAVIKLIASHYEYTYSVDLRYYKSHTGKSFSFDKYVADHHIDDVLCIGNAYYFLQSPFIINK